MLREADAIVVGEIKQAGLYRQTAQAFAVLLPVQSVGVMGDARTYADVVAVRSIDTEDFMTADWSHLPYDLLARISTRIINEVHGREPRGLRHQLASRRRRSSGSRGARDWGLGIRDTRGTRLPTGREGGYTRDAACCKPCSRDVRWTTLADCGSGDGDEHEVRS